MTDIEKSLVLTYTTEKKEKEDTCKLKCSHELDINDENEHLTVVDSVSVCTELEQLFNDFNIYNHHIKIFKKLLNLKELKNEYNFFAFNQPKTKPNNEPDCCSSSSSNLSSFRNPVVTSPSLNVKANESINSFNKLTDDLRSTLFKGGELSAMQVHSQLNKIKEQFKESQLLVTCLIHNIHRLRKNYCGTALDLVSSSELLDSLKKDHNALKTCKSIFKYQCSEKRKQLNKLKQQLKQVNEDWNQLIVKEPKIKKLTNEELLILNKTQKKCKSDENQLNKQSGNKLNDNLENNLEGKDNVDSSTNLNKEAQIKENQDQSTGESNCDSAVHSESEADSLQELATAIFRRKSKLDRLERECYSFMSRLANRNRPVDTEQNDKEDSEENDYPNTNHYDQNNLLIDEDDFDNFNDEYDEDLLDEEYDDVEFDDEDNVILNDPFSANEIDLENLINRFSNAEDELINQDLEDEENLSANDLVDFENRNNDVDLTNRLENISAINEEANTETHAFTDDYLIGQSRLINSSSLSENYENPNEIINRNLDEAMNSLEQIGNQTDNQDININSEILNQMPDDPSSIDNNEASASSNQDENSRLGLSTESLNSLVDTDVLVSRTNISEEAFAKTGEPVSLLRLRRRAVRILSERIKTEKQYYEERESELKQRLDSLQIKNCELEEQLNHLRPDSKLILISTAIVFSLIGYFLQNLN